MTKPAASLRAALRDRMPRVLGVKTGFNPNSSSLGIDVTFLLFGSLAASVLTTLAAGYLYQARARQKVEPHGSGEG